MFQRNLYCLIHFYKSDIILLSTRERPRLGPCSQSCLHCSWECSLCEVLGLFFSRGLISSFQVLPKIVTDFWTYFELDIKLLGQNDENLKYCTNNVMFKDLVNSRLKGSNCGAYIKYPGPLEQPWGLLSKLLGKATTASLHP